MKNKIKIKLFVLIALFGTMGITHLFAQEEQLPKATIKGQIVDDNSSPLSNCIVKAFLTRDVKVSDDEGGFLIEVISNRTDHISIDKEGYKTTIVTISNGIIKEEKIVLEKQLLLDDEELITLPYRKVKSSHNVSSINVLTGEELASYPTTSFLDALSGLLPGVYVNAVTSKPGEEYQSISVRGEAAIVYVDGVIRDPSDLSPSEVDKVEVIKDLPGRAMLGIYGSSPVIWISTNQGESYHRETKFTAEYGMNMATVLPEYVNSSDYAMLINEALSNDGYDPYYSQEAINAYKNNSDPLHYPNINYFDNYTKSASSFRRANISFSGGDDKVNYFSMVSYAGTSGLESVGEVHNNDRFKLRGNVNIKFNDYLKMNVNISGTYRTGRNPVIDVFSQVANLPANAHPVSYDSMYIISSDYPINIENSLVHGGFNQTSYLGTQNNVSVLANLSDITEGLSAKATVAFDGATLLNNYKYQSAGLYRLINASNGADSVELMQEQIIQNDLALGSNSIASKTVLFGSVDYNRVFNKHAFIADLSYYQGISEASVYVGYQPEKMQDFSLRAGYTYSDKYTVQIDQVVSGSMRMPKGKRFAYFPTVGLGWIASKEDFLKEVSAIDYLKVSASLGSIGVNDFGLTGYSSYHLYQTLWQQSGSWLSGIPGKFGSNALGYIIKQAGSDNYVMPKKRYFNVGIQSALFDNSLAIDLNYYRMTEYDIISQKVSYTPSLFGSGGFLPATNFGKTMHYGFDGAVQYSKLLGDIAISGGINLLYARGKYIEFDEPINQEDYRKYAGKQIDEFVMYQSEGLFQNQAEIDASEVEQNFGELKPGDIKYTDYNNDGTIDEKDIFRTGAHAPRISYGMNVSFAYKGFKVKAVGQGLADGKNSISGSYIYGLGTNRNLSVASLDRWPETNTMPRLSTSSLNNVQTSTFWLVDASCFRLKNVELSYTFPATTARKLLMSNCSVFVRGSNVMEFSAVSKYGMDPENYRAGIGYYPIFSAYTIGISCVF